MIQCLQMNYIFYLCKLLKILRFFLNSPRTATFLCEKDIFIISCEVRVGSPQTGNTADISYLHDDFTVTLYVEIQIIGLFGFSQIVK